MHRLVQSNNGMFVMGTPGKIHIITSETGGECFGDLETGETIPSRAERSWIREGFVDEVAFELSPDKP